MRKMKTLFKMDENHKMTNIPNKGTSFVFAGHSTPRIKLDGTACIIIDGKLHKRYDCKLNKKGGRKTPPAGWIACDPEPDPITGHWPGWAPIVTEDRWHREALDFADRNPAAGHTSDGTYELVGSKVQGNPYKIVNSHVLVKHNLCRVIELEGHITYESLKSVMCTLNEEGIVFHGGPDGIMFKLRQTDFDFVWKHK